MFGSGMKPDEPSIIVEGIVWRVQVKSLSELCLSYVGLGNIWSAVH